MKTIRRSLNSDGGGTTGYASIASRVNPHELDYTVRSAFWREFKKLLSPSGACFDVYIQAAEWLHVIVQKMCSI